MTQGDFSIPMCPLMVLQQGHEQQTDMATDNLRKNRTHCVWVLGETRRGESEMCRSGNRYQLPEQYDMRTLIDGSPATPAMVRESNVLDWLALAVEEIIGAFRFSCENLNNSRSFRFASEKFANRSS
jgi:hypothetical protein